MRATIVWRGWRVRRTTHSNWAFQTTANRRAYGGGVNQALRQLATQRKTPLTEYTLQCEYGQLAGIEALLGQFAGKIVSSDYQASVRLRVALPFAHVNAFSTKLADFSRGSLQLLAIEE